MNSDNVEKNAQDFDNSSKAVQDQKPNQNTSKSKTKSIQRCPKCRSINPPDAKYCQQCGKVFRTNE
ncbi:MAG: zinc-ribbon domain-containing protein [Candidatus Thorarchaeota archaeon]